MASKQRKVRSADEKAQPMPGRMYPVISVNLDAVESALAEQGRPFAFHEQGVDALKALASTTKRALPPIGVWAREGPGLDRSNRAAHLTFLYVVAPRESGKLSVELHRLLNARWADMCTLEGSHPLRSDERVLWRLDAGGAVVAS